MQRINKYTISYALIVMGIISTGLFAQTTTSTIEGTVTDSNGAVVAGAQVKANSSTLSVNRTVVSNKDGFYRIVALPAGNYTLEFSNTGFATRTSKIELTLNRTAVLNAQLAAGGATNIVDVTSELALIEPNASTTGATITPKKIQDLPVNGREYLDLLQLVPGVAINRQSSGDNATPVLGERSGNNNFFIDGQPNKDTVNGGPAAQFNQETIAEFQVLTSAYKAEFGQASGAIVNVITKSGGNDFHGVGSLFHRNDAFDSVNSLDSSVTDAPDLSRYDYSFAVGGPLINPGFGVGTPFFHRLEDKAFFFASVERITEDRGIDFAFPDLGDSAGATVVENLLHDQEDPFEGPQRTRATRAFLKFNQQFERHQLVQEINWTNEHVIGSGQGLPSTRSDSHARHLLLGFGDTMLLGDMGNPWIVTLRGGYRDEPSDNRGSVPGVVGSTLFNPFTVQIPFPQSFALFGDLPSVLFGRATTPSNLLQKYSSFSASANKLIGDHDVKFGWQFVQTKVDGIASKTFTNQLFTTIDDFVNLGSVNGGLFLLLEVGGLTPEADEIHLRNNFNALYVQDDWKILKNLTVNLGIRWDKDSEFEAKQNFAPRLGVAWAVTPKTVIRANFGKFYDQFRLGLVSNIPAFGGADRRLSQSFYYPRGFYGSPSALSSLAFIVGLPGPCISNNLTDAQITAGAVGCSFFGGPIVGVDRLNNIGPTAIPANTPFNINNVQALSGLTPAQFLTAAAASIGQPDGYFGWGSFGLLRDFIIPPQTSETEVHSTFRTPHTLGFSVGFQRELTNDMMIEVDYFHREMKNLLGVRQSNLRFESRVAGIGRSFNPPNTLEAITTFGPFFEGKYDAVIVNFNKRLSNRYLIGANYTYAKATDNSLGINVGTTDNWIGIVPVVTEPGTGTSNANGSFISTNGNLVQEAGTFHNGPDLDKGPSSLALDHIFQVNGLVDLPWQFQVSGIFRYQSGFHFSQNDELNRDPDGNGNFNGIDFTAGRNAFSAAPFVNLDMRFSKRFDIGERVNVQLLFEFFNVLNRQNPAAIQNRRTVTTQAFGSTTQVLPGREGQVGIRISF